jgi:hypothetical protein
MLVNYYAALSAAALFVANSGATVPLNLAAGATARFVLGPYTTPAGAVSGYLKLNDLDGGAEVTAYQVELASTYGGYFDGDTTGASWDGTAGNSTSTIRQLLEAVRISDSFGRAVTAPGRSRRSRCGSRVVVDQGHRVPGRVAADPRVVPDLVVGVGSDPRPEPGQRVHVRPEVVRARVSRRPAGGTWQLVRGGPSTSSTAAWSAGRRLRVPQSGVDLEYRIEGLSGAAAGRDGGAGRDGHPPQRRGQCVAEVHHPAALNRRLDFMGRTEVSRDSRTAVYRVQNRSDPVVVSDVHSSRQFTIKVKTETPAETEALDHALSQGLPCYLQVPATINTPSIYATDRVVQLRGAATRSQRNVWTIPLTEVAPPPPSIVSPQATWQQLLDQYATWEDVMAAVPTWMQIAD